jgi:hypothetical protein
MTPLGLWTDLYSRHSTQHTRNDCPRLNCRQALAVFPGFRGLLEAISTTVKKRGWRACLVTSYDAVDGAFFFELEMPVETLLSNGLET